MRRTLIALTLMALAACQLTDRGGDTARAVTQSGTQVATVAFRVPSDSEITSPEILRSVRRGRALLAHTRDSLPSYVANRLQCVSCHVADGTRKDALSLIGVYSRFPQYRSRSGRVDMIEDRINDCFERSMNGRAIDRSGQDMRDLVAYMAFLSRGVPVGAQVDGQSVPMLDPVAGDTVRAVPLYASSCAPCHGTDGLGTNAAPPLWGPHSFTVGAGMARVRMAAAFIRVAMPQHQPGTLTPQQAFDLATYINTRPRPDFAQKALDWPNGDVPPDVAYSTRSRPKGNQARLKE
jgi:thiosulfate dehydrogenase